LAPNMPVSIGPFCVFGVFGGWGKRCLIFAFECGVKSRVVCAANSEDLGIFSGLELALLGVVLIFLLGRREGWRVEAKKIAIIVADVSAGFIVVLVGLEILSFPLNVVWGLFNVWLWIVSPTMILLAEKKEEGKKPS